MSQSDNPTDLGGDPAPPPKPLASWYTQSLSDGLGDRLLMFDNSNAPSLELLRLRPELTEAPGFEAALRESVRRLAHFRHPGFARVRSVQHLEPDEGLALVSNYTPGKRLSEVLHQTRGPAFAAALIRQLTPALALLQQQHGGEMAHGVLSADRIVVTPEGRLTIVEHVLGAAIAALDLSPEQLAELGIVLPPDQGDDEGGLDASADWYQLGLIAVSVLLGRPVATHERPRMTQLLNQAARAAEREGESLPPALREWLERALQVDGRTFASGAEAIGLLEESVRGEQPRDTPRPVAALAPAQAVAAPPSVARAIAEPPAPVVDRARAADAVAPGVKPAASAPASARREDLRPRQRPAAQPTRAPGDSRPAQPRAAAAAAATPGAPAQYRTLFDREPAPPAGRMEPEYAPSGGQSRRGDRTAATRARRDTDARRGSRSGQPQTFRSAVTALAVLCAAESVIIAGAVFGGWLTPQPAIVAQPTPGGASVALNGRSPETMPLRTTVASDMRWVRVVSPTPAVSVAGAAPKPPAGGALRVSAPIEVQVYDNKQLLGTMPGAPFDLAPGRHDIEIANAALGYRLRQSVDIGAGQTLTVFVAPADGAVSVSASPWAEVWIDGVSRGRTPLAGVALSAGEHDFAFGHPERGVDHQKVVVKSGAVTRVAANLRH